jgi:hypothetical protein
VKHLYGHAFCAGRALPPHPLQRLGERLTAGALRLLLHKFANGEVRLLLAGARTTESYTPDLHGCWMGTRALRFTSHLARFRNRRLGQEKPPSNEVAARYCYQYCFRTSVTD